VEVHGLRAARTRNASHRRSPDGWDYHVALRLATDLRQRVARRYGSESMDLARVEDRLVAALVKNGRGGTPEALRVAEHAMGVEEVALGT
jgi:hypothetical protein